MRSGWLSQQDQATFSSFLQPIAAQGWQVRAILSDKQRGLEPAVAAVFPAIPHAWCQLHYLNNAAEPVATGGRATESDLAPSDPRPGGPVDSPRSRPRGARVLTVTGLLPSPLAPAAAGPASTPRATAATPAEAHASIVKDLLRRVRYLLTLKGRPPFGLAGLEMVERLSEVVTCLDRLLDHEPEARLAQLRSGLQQALADVQADYTLLRQAGNWLQQLAALLDPDGEPQRTGAQVRGAFEAYLTQIAKDSAATPRLHAFSAAIAKVSRSYAPGLFHTYDLPGLPRTNNDRESEFRNLNRRLLRTTGQKGLTRRILQQARGPVRSFAASPNTLTATRRGTGTHYEARPAPREQTAHP